MLKPAFLYEQKGRRFKIKKLLNLERKCDMIRKIRDGQRPAVGIVQRSEKNGKAEQHENSHCG